MRSGFGQASGQTFSRPSEPMPAVGAVPAVKEIPYDYVARFKLLGRPGNRVQDVINISTDGGFVAVAIGYSFIPATTIKQPILPPVENLPPPADAPSGPGPAMLAAEIMANPMAGCLTEWLSLTMSPEILAQHLAARLCGIEFRYSIVDSGSGRELQNQPIHNIAGLGEASGSRPFRPLAKPMLFMPRSTIRIEIEEISQGRDKDSSGKYIGSYIYGYDDGNNRVGSEVYMVLHGYKMLGYGTAMP